MRHPAHVGNPAWPRTEAQQGEVAAEVGAAQEPHFGEEVGLHLEPLDLGAVAIGVVVDETAVAEAVALDALRARRRHVAVEPQVLEEPEAAVDADAVVAADPARGGRAVGAHRADGAAGEDVALDAEHGEVGAVDAGGVVGAGLDVEGADGRAPALAVEPAARQQGDLAAAVEADAPAEEEERGIATAGGQPGAGPAGEGERAGALEEEVALLGEEQVEAGQVDLLFVYLHLREVGVHRQVGGQVLGEPVLDVAAEAGFGIAVDRRLHRAIGGEAAEHVRLQLDGPAVARAPRGR